MITSVLNRHKSVKDLVGNFASICSNIGDMSALCEADGGGASCEPSQSAGPPPPPHHGADHCSCVWSQTPTSQIEDILLQYYQNYSCPGLTSGSYGFALDYNLDATHHHEFPQRSQDFPPE